MYQVRWCPKGDLCTTVCKDTNSRGRIEFPDGKGYSNPRLHLLSCCYSNNMELMIYEYWEAVGAKNHQSTLTFTTTSASSTHQKLPCDYQIASQNERDLFDWINSLTPMVAYMRPLFFRAWQKCRDFSNFGPPSKPKT